MTSLGHSANDSWASYDFAGGELAANGSFGMNQTAQMNGYGFELDGASASRPARAREDHRPVRDCC